jgi:hypothetical protein
MYLLVARKRHYPLTMVRQKRWLKAPQGAGLPVANRHAGGVD